MLIHWIWLATREGMNDREKRAVLEHFRDPEDVFFGDAGRYAQVEGLSEDGRKALEDKNLLPAENILAECARKKIHIMTIRDGAYPARLKNITDPPLVLYYKGTLPDWNRQPVIGIVGTRKSTSYGNETAERFGRQIARCGALVISGGAAGIDTYAMYGALESGMPTVGVLGCGVDVVYPAENKGLFEKVIAQGCLLSEYPPGTKGMSWHFPARNRIISGISNGILVVEAPERSGAMNTARHALNQGRDVFVVPGNIDVPNCAGSNSLLQDRATPVFQGWDILKEYAAQWPETVANRPDIRPAKRPVPEELPVASVKIAIDKEEKSTYSVLNSEELSLSETEKSVLAQLEPSPKPLDEVISQLDMPAASVRMMLTKLSIKGIVVMHPGGRVSLK